MRFPLADWIDDHAGCRYDFGTSGMRGTVRLPVPSAADLRSATEEELRRGLAEAVGVDRARVFLTHGASEANSYVVFFVRRGRKGTAPRCRVSLPEYPPLFDVAREVGFRIVRRRERCDLAVISQPRNPAGELWEPERLEEWSLGARETLVDETFREFTHARSFQRLGRPGFWTTGTFTKVYGADDLRVGFVVAPESETEQFARFHGLVGDRIPTYSVAAALAVLRHRESILKEVWALTERHEEIWRRANPGSPKLAAPVAFDDPVPTGGDRFSRRCVRSSVLVSPGSFFGRPSGVRVCMTRRSFPRDLPRYLRIRAAG